MVSADVHAAGIPLIVDLSSPRLEHVLPHEPDLVKCNDWELAEYVAGPVDGEQRARGRAEAGRRRRPGRRSYPGRGADSRLAAR